MIIGHDLHAVDRSCALNSAYCTPIWQDWVAADVVPYPLPRTWRAARPNAHHETIVASVKLHVHRKRSATPDSILGSDHWHGAGDVMLGHASLSFDHVGIEYASPPPF